MKKPTYKYFIGIDEAGRGPLAGPVAIGIVKFPAKVHPTLIKELRKISGKDSKKLSEKNREIWFEKIKAWQQENKLDFYVALVSAHHIDTKGISHAIKTGIKKCLQVITKNSNQIKKSHGLTPKDFFVQLDGSLKAPEEFCFQETIIKGDEKVPIISLASIAAKVTRDRYMVKLASKYPEYGFNIHKGYGTTFHQKMLKKHGFSEHHRLTFCKNIKVG